MLPLALRDQLDLTLAEYTYHLCIADHCLLVDVLVTVEEVTGLQPFDVCEKPIKPLMHMGVAFMYPRW